MKDFFGIDIKEGDFLFYAIRAGNVAGVKIGKVKEVREKYVVIYSVQMKYSRDGDRLIEVPSDKLSRGNFMSTEKSMIISEEKAVGFAPILKKV